MGSRNSKSNDDNEKVASNQEPINDSNKNNLDEINEQKSVGIIKEETKKEIEPY